MINESIMNREMKTLSVLSCLAITVCDTDSDTDSDTPSDTNSETHIETHSATHKRHSQ